MLAVRGARGCAVTSTVRPRLAGRVMRLAACRPLSTAAHSYDYDLVILGVFPGADTALHMDLRSHEYASFLI